MDTLHLRARLIQTAVFTQVYRRPPIAILRFIQTAVFMIALGSLTLTPGCGSTGGALVTLPFQAGGAARAAAGPMTFNTPNGWTVTLTQAVIALGPFYFNISPPEQNVFRSGTVIIEATEQVIVDVLDPDPLRRARRRRRRDGQFTGGRDRSLPARRHPTCRRSRAARLHHAGQLPQRWNRRRHRHQERRSVPFSGYVIIDQAQVTATETLADLQRVNGAVASLVFTPAPQTLTLRVDPTDWFQQADFSQLAAGYSGTSLTNGAIPGTRPAPSPTSSTRA